MDGIRAREASFFDATSPTKPSVAATVADRNVAWMFSWLGDLHGKRALDICCGTGGTTVTLALAGADVTGCDISEVALSRTADLARDNGVKVTVERQAVEDHRDDWEGRFDVIFGSYALHHLDLSAALANLASYMRPGARAVFVETSVINPMLRWARAYLVGRFGIPRIGTLDEHPLTRKDVAAVARAFGSCDVIVAEYRMLRIFDRQLFGGRRPLVSVLCGWADEIMAHIWRLGSYHIVLACGPACTLPEQNWITRLFH